MDFSVILSALQTISIIAGILVAIGTIKGRNNDQVEELAELKTDVRYIKEKVDDLPQLKERLTIVDQKAIRANERIDELVKRVDSIEKR